MAEPTREELEAAVKRVWANATPLERLQLLAALDKMTRRWVSAYLGLGVRRG